MEVEGAFDQRCMGENGMSQDGCIPLPLPPHPPSLTPSRTLFPIRFWWKQWSS